MQITARETIASAIPIGEPYSTADRVLTALKEAGFEVTAPSDRDTHRGWLIELNWFDRYEATHPDYDPTPDHPGDGPSDNRFVTADTRDELIAEIDDYIAENGA